MKRTKKEDAILARVGDVNSRMTLCGLAEPAKPDFHSKENRFVKRLAEAGLIVFVEYTPKYGSGWALPENVEKFSV